MEIDVGADSDGNTWYKVDAEGEKGFVRSDLVHRMTLSEYEDYVYSQLEKLSGGTDDNASTTQLMEEISVGGKLFFGKYQEETIEWRVLHKQEDLVLLISQYVLDWKQYHDKWGDMTWAESSLRTWLNGDFYSATFTEAEKACILLTTVGNPNNPIFKTVGGMDTDDHIFLLSIEEAERFFLSNEDRQASLAAYAQQTRGYVYVNKSGHTAWGLRSPGRRSYHAALVDYHGVIYSQGYEVYKRGFRGYGLRPALWLNLQSVGQIVMK